MTGRDTAGAQERAITITDLHGRPLQTRHIRGGQSVTLELLATTPRETGRTVQAVLDNDIRRDIIASWRTDPTEDEQPNVRRISARILYQDDHHPDVYRIAPGFHLPPLP